MTNIPKNVFVLGLVSLFNDIASEMIYPIIPIFLTSVLGAPVSVVGLIEGVAEATASIMKFLSGYLSDKIGRRKIFVTGGYGFSSIAKLLIALAYTWPFVLFARFLDRFGKGVRTSARDSILLQNATSQNKGFIFGFHRSMDSIGAVLGPIFALVLLYLFENNMRLIFIFAFIPSVVGVLLLVFFIKEKRKEEKNEVIKSGKGFNFSLNWHNLNPGFKFFFIVSIIFFLGNSSDAFLILRAQDLGLAATLVTLAYVLYNVFQVVFSTPVGKLADKISARSVYSYGLIIFSIVYLLFGLIDNSIWIWVLFPIYGIYTAFTEGVSKAYISEFMTEKESGTYFGVYQAGIAFASFFASFFGGLLWTNIGPSATFFFGSAMAFLAFIIFSFGKVFNKV